MRRFLPGLLLLGATACGGGADAGASLRFETSRLDLGTMHQYEEREFVLPFRVEGSGAIRVDVLDTSCGCTDVRLVVNGETLLQAEKDHSAPAPEKPEDEQGLSASAGDRKIEIPARAEKRTNDQIVTVTIAGSMLNSPAKSQIHAFVKPAFEVAGGAGNFGTLRESVLKAGEIPKEFTVLAPAAFTVKFWKNVPANLLVEAMPGPAEAAPDGAGVLQKFRLRLLPATAVGTTQILITAETSLGPAPLEVPVAWRVLGRVVYAPEHLVQFMSKPNDRDHEVVVKIRPSSKEEAVPKPTAEFLGETAGVLKVAVEPLTESDQGLAGWLLRVKLPKGTPAGVYKVTLRISYPAASGIAAKEMDAYARVQEPR